MTHRLYTSQTSKIQFTFQISKYVYFTNIYIKINFKSLIVQVGVKECIIQSDSTLIEQKELQRVLHQLQTTITLVKKSLFSDFNLMQDLNRVIDLTNIHDIRQHVSLSNPISNRALNTLVDYLQLKTSKNANQYTLSTHDLYEFVKLDPAAVTALHLMPLNDNQKGTKSLYNILNTCQTAQGSRLLAQWIKQPLLSKRDIGTLQMMLIFYI